jgi:hypothetical protein
LAFTLVKTLSNSLQGLFVLIQPRCKGALLVKFKTTVSVAAAA